LAHPQNNPHQPGADRRDELSLVLVKGPEVMDQIFGYCLDAGGWVT